MSFFSNISWSRLNVLRNSKRPRFFFFFSLLLFDSKVWLVGRRSWQWLLREGQIKCKCTLSCKRVAAFGDWDARKWFHIRGKHLSRCLGWVATSYPLDTCQVNFTTATFPEGSEDWRERFCFSSFFFVFFSCPASEIQLLFSSTFRGNSVTVPPGKLWETPCTLFSLHYPISCCSYCAQSRSSLFYCRWTPTDILYYTAGHHIFLCSMSVFHVFSFFP